MTDFTGVVLDLEMTGLNPKTDKIIEIGAIKVQNGKMIDTFGKLICPGRLLSEHTKNVTNITDEMLRNQPDFAAITDELMTFIGEDVLLGHHILKDYSFLKRSILNVLPKGSRFERSGIDTLKIARSLLPAEQKKTLVALCELYEIEHHPHRAIDDAKATFLLYEKLWQQFGDRHKDKFSPYALHYQVKREAPIMQKQIEQIERFLKDNHIDCPYDISMMTKNEASRYYDQLKSGVTSTSGKEFHQGK